MFKYFMILSIFVLINCEDTSSPKGDIVPTSYKCGGTGIMETHYSYTCTKPDTKTNSLTDSSTINKEVAEYQKNSYACTIYSKELGVTTYHEYTCVKTDTQANTSTDSSSINTEVSNFESDGYTCSKSDEKKEEQCDSADNMCLCATNCDKYNSYVCSYYTSEEDALSKCLVTDCTVAMVGQEVSKQNECIDACRKSVYNSTNNGNDPDSQDEKEWPKDEWFRNQTKNPSYIKPETSPSDSKENSIALLVGANSTHKGPIDGFSDPLYRHCQVYKLYSNDKYYTEIQLTYRGSGTVTGDDMRDISLQGGILSSIISDWKDESWNIQLMQDRKDFGWYALFEFACKRR